MSRPKEPVKLLQYKDKSHMSHAKIQERESCEVQASTDKIGPPAWLSKKQAEEFRILADELKNSGLMSNLDNDILAAYVTARSRMVSLEKRLHKKSVTENIIEYEKTLGLWNKTVTQCLSLAKSLGMTMDSRSRLTVPPGSQKQETERDWLFGD